MVVPASAGDRFVAPTGSDAANDCLNAELPCRSIGHAVAVVGSGDVVKVAGGILDFRRHSES